MSAPPQTESGARRPGRPRQDASDGSAVRERLLDAVTELTVEQGFDACGLREIAARAEVSSGMISYYFGDRQGLYEAMFQRAIDRVADQVTALIEDRERAGQDRLDELVRIHVGAVSSDPWLPRLILREVLAKQDSTVAGVLKDRVAEDGPLTLIVRWIEEEQARGVLRADLDPKMMAISLASVAVFPFLMLPMAGEELGLEIGGDFADRLVAHNQQLLSHGIRAREEDGR